jgi:hypothetical protein
LLQRVTAIGKRVQDGAQVFVARIQGRFDLLAVIGNDGPRDTPRNFACRSCPRIVLLTVGSSIRGQVRGHCMAIQFPGNGIGERTSRDVDGRPIGGQSCRAGARPLRSDW